MTTSLLLIHRQLKKITPYTFVIKVILRKLSLVGFCVGFFFYESFVDNVMRGLFATHMISTCI